MNQSYEGDDMARHKQKRQGVSSCFVSLIPGTDLNLTCRGMK